MRSGEIVKNTMQLLMAHGRFVSFFFFSGQLSSCLSLFGLSVSRTRSTVGTHNTAAKRSTLSKNYYCRGRFDADRRRGTHAHWWLCSGPTIKIYRYARLSHSPPYLGVGDGVRAAHIYIFFLLYLFISLVYVYYALYNNILHTHRFHGPAVCVDTRVLHVAFSASGWSKYGFQSEIVPLSCMHII